MALAKEWLEKLKVEDVLNSEMFEKEKTEEIGKAFKEHQPFPFHHLKNFMDHDFLKKLRTELEHLDYYKKNNDLYEFAQSQDLKSCTAKSFPLIHKFKEVLYSKKFCAFLKKVTGIEVVGLSESVSVSAAVYEDGHHLLCHDDELEGRRIAYILYLVPSDEKDTHPTQSGKKKKNAAPITAWAREDGGCLDLFNVDAKGEPSVVADSIVPEWNSFVFFEVSPKSYHQVAEVTSKKSRLSISGWFHGKPFPRPAPVKDVLPTFATLTEEKCDLDDWVNREYRKLTSIKKIKKTFSDESSIELPDFLRRDKYDLLFKELEEQKWNLVGPPNKKHYSSFSDSSSPTITAFRAFLLSQTFGEFLSQLTGLEPSSVHQEVRRFVSGDYTLGHDLDPEIEQSGLDVWLTCMTPRCKWTTTVGGSCHYLVAGEAEELATLYPRENSLTMIYRTGGGIVRFVKYVNHLAPGKVYQINQVYRVKEDDEE